MTREEASDAIWRDAITAARILAADAHAIGGVLIRGHNRAAAECWLQYLQTCLHSRMLRLPIHADGRQLSGGLDLAATLTAGRPVYESGLLVRANCGVIVLPNAECAAPSMVSALATALDTGLVESAGDGAPDRAQSHFGVVACDEGQEDQCGPLRDRLAIELNFEVASPVFPKAVSERIDGAGVRMRAQRLEVVDDVIESLVTVCDALGVVSPRVPFLALRVARLSAALGGRASIDDDDLAYAARVVIAPRATRLPAGAEAEPETDAPDPNEAEELDDDDAGSRQQRQNLDDMLIAASVAALPPNVLADLTAGLSRSSRGSAAGRSGAKQTSTFHGRRLGARRGRPRRQALLDIVETLRAAAPWQIVRKLEAAAHRATQQETAASKRIEVRPSDFRVRRFKHKRETVTIFAVDASGSTALHRLGEAKGAIELLLGDCYTRRDHVALIAFRDRKAEVILPVTRSLTRVKREVGALPGGGGTPLASAAEAAATLAAAESSKGRTPTLVFLTDGKANVDRAGSASRERAFEDALAAARSIRSAKHAAMVIDTSPRPALQSKQFANAMGAVYLPLPYARAEALSAALKGLR